MVHDEYDKAKQNGIIGMQYIETLRHTTNLIDTAVKSSKYIDQNKSNDIALDNDFFWNTIDHAKTISNSEVLELIAKILAGEYNKPGSYSMSTLHVLKMLGKKELQSPETTCSLCFGPHLILEKRFELPESVAPILEPLTVTFGSLQALQVLGLFLSKTMWHTSDNPERGNIVVKYFHREIRFKPLHNIWRLVEVPSYYQLSIAGQEIIQHLDPKYNDDYYTWLRENLKFANYELEI